MDTPRFALSAAELSECFAAAGCIPVEEEFFTGLPPASGSLPQSLAGLNGELDLALIISVRAAAEPMFSLRYRSFSRTGEIRIYASQQGANAVFARCEDGRWDLTLMWDRKAALAVLDALTLQPEDVDFFVALEQALAKARDIEAEASIGFCGSCGTLFDDSPAFCRECGERLKP